MANYRFNEQKATEAATMLLNLKGGRSDYWWIIKILYLLDREAFRRWERPVTYDYYESLKYGPVVMTIYNIIKKNIPASFWKGYILTLPKNSEVMLNGTPAPIRKLSRAEIELIKQIYQKFGGYTGKQLVEYTHHLPEWHDPKGSTIPIQLPDLLSALDYDAENVERIVAEIDQEQAVDALFG
jgi:uncharacterized phage-associated protein